MGLKVHAVSTVGFFAIDRLWLGVVAWGFCRRQLGGLPAAQVNRSRHPRHLRPDQPATLKGCPLGVTMVGIVWGMTLCTVVAAAGCAAAR
jgi:uncharacterized membrane protein